MDSSASSFSLLKPRDYEFIKFILTVDSLRLASSVIEGPPLQPRELSQVQLELNPILNLHQSLLRPIQDGAKVIVCMLHALTHYEAFWNLNSSTIERVRGSQRNHIQSMYAMRVSPVLDVRGLLVTDYIDDNVYRSVEDQVLSSVTSICGLDTVNPENDIERPISCLENLYAHPTYVSGVDINRYMRILQTVMNDTSDVFQLSSDTNRSCVASVVNDFLFLCSLKNLCYRLRKLIQDVVGWIVFSADMLLNDLMILGLQIPPIYRFVCDLIEAVGGMRRLNPFTSIYDTRNDDTGNGEEPVKLQDLYRVFIRALCKLVREIMNVSPDTYLDIHYLKYRLSTWSSPREYPCLQQIAGELDFSRTQAPSVEDPDMFPVGRPVTLPRLVYPLCLSFTNSVTDASDTLVVSTSNPCIGTTFDVLRDLYNQRPPCFRPPPQLSYSTQQSCSNDVEMYSNDQPLQGGASSSGVSSSTPSFGYSSLYTITQGPSYPSGTRTAGSVTFSYGNRLSAAPSCPANDITMSEDAATPGPSAAMTAPGSVRRARRISIGDSAYRVSEENLARVRHVLEQDVLPKCMRRPPRR
ncbi:tegument protein UL35 [Elephantid betaherpesvirus 1]|uniref:Tegument protein UL35 n=1 Tax=Elephantid herpesvirus 1 TaxID=146015 RepID=M4JUD3_ELHV1|nr:tegument protein UL35 [Elephantid betaherpesvirus 1]AGE10018.1 tegument protein UL35 [Elephantid betaherpesvirus 1]